MLTFVEIGIKQLLGLTDLPQNRELDLSSHMQVVHSHGLWEDRKNNRRDVVTNDMKTKDTKGENKIAGRMGYSDRYGGSSGEGNKQDLSKNYKTENKTDKKRDKITDKLRKLLRRRTSS